MVDNVNKTQNEKAVQAQAGPAANADTQAEKKTTILVIEDDPVLCRMYSEKFKTEGYNVLVAQDGKEGLKAALEESVDLVLLDVMLPRMSGIDLLEQLRKDPKGSKTDVIVLTNLADPSEKERALKLGVKDYLVKAMQTPEQVVEKAKSFLDK